MRRSLLLLCALLTLPLCAAEGYRIEGIVVAPVRPVAEWLGAGMSVNPETKAVTLTKGATALALTRNSTKGINNGQPLALAGPVFVYKGTTYVPLRAVAEACGAHLAWDAKTNTATLSGVGDTPFTCVVTPFPRPACVADDTLAGLTPGDHLAVALARWGEPVKVSKSECGPKVKDYEFRVSPAEIFSVDVHATGDTIGMIVVAQMGDLDAVKHAKEIANVGTAHGFRFVGPTPRLYGLGTFLSESPSGDQFIYVFPRGRLLLATEDVTFNDDQPSLARMSLVEHTAPRQWYEWW